MVTQCIVRWATFHFRQIVQKWHSLRFYIARTGETESCDLISILKVGRLNSQALPSWENVARFDHFSPANNSFVLPSRTIISVHTIIFCVLDCMYVPFRFYVGVLSDISRCESYGGLTHNEASFLVASCTRRHAQSRGRVVESRDVHYACKWVAPNSTASLLIISSFSSLYQFHSAIIAFVDWVSE